MRLIKNYNKYFFNLRADLKKGTFHGLRKFDGRKMAEKK